MKLSAMKNEFVSNVSHELRSPLALVRGYAEMLADPEVEAVYVATPHPFHKPHTLLCLEAGKAVLCEKPFAMNAGEAEEAMLRMTCERAGIEDGMDVLDLGCGWGSFTGFAAERYGVEPWLLMFAWLLKHPAGILPSCVTPDPRKEDSHASQSQTGGPDCRGAGSQLAFQSCRTQAGRKNPSADNDFA